MTHAEHVLEWDVIRGRLAGHAETARGHALASELSPSYDVEDVGLRLAQTWEAYEVLSREVVPSLGAVKVEDAALVRAAKGGVLGGEELFRVGDALAALRAFRDFFQNKHEAYPQLSPWVREFPELPKVEHGILKSVEPSGEVKDSASDQLASIRRRKASALAKVQEKIQSYTTGRFRDLLSDPIVTQRDGRYVVPVKAGERGKIKGIVHDTSASGQTLFIEPDDVLAAGNQVRELEGAERDEVMRILGVLSVLVGEFAQPIRFGVEAAGELDLRFASARLAFEMRASRPDPLRKPGMTLEGARHPMLDPDKVVPIDLEVGTQHAGLLITGPNTGGKTVAMKTVGLFALMAQSGLFLPARRVRFGAFSQVWADIGDEQSLQHSLSTFSAHIRNIAEAIKGIKEGALVLFDEIGAGTDPSEGASLAKAILTTLRDKGAVIVASTHYGELKAFAYNTEGFANAAMEFDVKSLGPTYRVLMGAPGASQALRIAERYGIPAEIVQRAKDDLGSEHQEVAKLMEQLELARKQARIAQGEADRRLEQARQLEAKANKKLEEADETKRKASLRAADQLESTLRELRLQAQEVFDALKASPRDPKALDQARKDLQALQELGAERTRELKPHAIRPAEGDAPLKRGDSVHVDGYVQIGTLLTEPENGKVTVQMGPIKLTLPVSGMRRVASEPKAKTSSRGTKIVMQKTQTATREISLRGERVEDAMQMLQRFLDDAVLGGIDVIRVVHGKGEGILRKAIRDWLRGLKEVDSFADADPAEGGQGVTLVRLR